MDLSTPDQQADWQALERLLHVARWDTGQARRAWHNAEEKWRLGPGGFVERRCRESRREVSVTHGSESMIFSS
jgi:hypothetical protein